MANAQQPVMTCTQTMEARLDWVSSLYLAQESDKLCEAAREMVQPQVNSLLTILNHDVVEKTTNEDHAQVINPKL